MTGNNNLTEPPAEVLALLDEMRREVAEAPWIGNPNYSALAGTLRAFAAEPTIAAIGGLLTVPASDRHRAP